MLRTGTVTNLMSQARVNTFSLDQGMFFSGSKAAHREVLQWGEEEECQQEAC